MREERWPLPPTWEWRKAGDIARIVGGGTPPASDKSNFDDEGIPWITPADLTGYGDVYISAGRRSLSEKGLASCGAQIMPKGTVLYSSRAPIGYCAIASNPIATNQGFKSLVLHEGYVPEFIRYYLLYAKEYAESLASGTTFKELSGARLSELLIPITSLQEQHKVVTKLDHLSKRFKTVRAELDRIPRLVERYKRAVLSAAFRGTLTSDWRELHGVNETGADVVNRIAHQYLRKQLSTKGESKILREEAGQRRTGKGELPRTWKWATIESVGRVMLGRQRSPANHVGPYMRPYLRAANITWDGLDLSDVKEMNFDERDFERFKLQPNDVLINEGSGSAGEVGKPAIWKGEIQNCCFQNTLVMVRPYLEMSEYIYFALLHAAMSGAFVDETRGVNINHIGRQGLAEFPIAIAPLDEQREIVSRIRTAFTSIERVGKQTQRAALLTDRLEQSTFAKAFRGELVSHSGDDEATEFLVDHAPTKTKRNSNPEKRLKNYVRGRAPMQPVTMESARETILSIPGERISFDDLRAHLETDYETLREIIFGLLDEPNPVISQVFDLETRSIVFSRSEK